MKIKSKVTRISIILAAMAAGSFLFIAMLYAGDRSKGPLEDVMNTVSLQVTKVEKRIMKGDDKETRTESLSWLGKYRKSIALAKSPDTILLGAFDNDTRESYESIVSLEDSLNTKLPLIQQYSAWGSKTDQVFPAIRIQAIWDLGSLPLITWEPWMDDFDPVTFPELNKGTNKNLGGMKAIAEGKFDKYIDKWASSAKEFGHPFYLRFGHEMNDPYRYPWGPQNNKPEEYIAAWKHVVNRFKTLGATNAIWVWAPHPAYTNYASYYPGNDYVDFIATTALNYGNVAQWSKWYSFDETFNKFYKDFSFYGKPIMITEFGTLNVGGDRAKWYKEALALIPQKYPVVKSVLFFHNAADKTTTYKSLDWSFKEDKAVVDAIKQSLSLWKQPKKSLGKKMG